MALFGAPLSYEDHAVRACYAALRMQARLAAYRDELQRNRGMPFQIRVGLNSGEVVIRAVGSDLQMAFSAVGQTVHLASRLEQLAKPGTILTTQETVNLVGPQVAVRPLGPVRVKGLAEAIEAYEVVGAAAVGSTMRLRSMFVGREERWLGSRVPSKPRRRVLDSSSWSSESRALGRPGFCTSSSMYAEQRVSIAGRRRSPLRSHYRLSRRDRHPAPVFRRGHW